MTRTTDERIASHLIDWVLLNGVGGGDTLDMRLYLVRRDEIGVDGFRDCAGTAATLGHDMIATEVFVSETRCEPPIRVSNGRGSGTTGHGSPRYRSPMSPLLTIAAAFRAVGASENLETIPIQRLHRDRRTPACDTVFDLDIGAANHGRLLLGRKPIAPI
jgi:hypothetical protein